MSGLVARLKSLARAFTEPRTIKNFGHILLDDKTSQTLTNPRKTGFRNTPGGLFWMAEHDGGIYMVEASLFKGYIEMTPNPHAGGGKIDVKSAGGY